MADGVLSFSSWVRRGLAASLEDEDLPGATSGIATNVALTVVFNSDEETTVRPVLPLVGAGEIVGLNSDVICRVWPDSEDLDAESVSYPVIEFDQADLLWRYTGAKAPESGDAEGRLRPWMSLLVLKVEEGSMSEPTASQSLPILTPDLAALPDPDQLWALAHTQFQGEDLTEQEAKGKIEGQPGLFTGRLVSNRLLQKNTEYIAYLVPTFERGRLAGLGELGDAPTTDALAKWNLAAPGFKLPVYHSWRFSTGSIGNFEEAARLLKPFVLPAHVGFRDMDVSEPGPGLSEATNDGAALPAEGALMSVAAFEQGRPEWENPKRDEFIGEIEAKLNAPALAASPPVLAPPLYGQWYAAQNKLDNPAGGGENPPWFHELNSDPRNRVGAALGTEVIQREQQALMAGSWDQVEEIETINEKLRALQLARGTVNLIYKRHYLPLGLQLFYQLTRRFHGQIVCGDDTICKRARNSPLVPGLLSGQWLRWSRTFGPIGRVQGRPESDPPSPTLIELCNGPGRPAPEPKDPGGIHVHNPNGPGRIGGGVSCEYLEGLISLGVEVNVQWGLLLMWVARELMVSENGKCWWFGLKLFRYASLLIEISIHEGDPRWQCKWVSSEDVPDPTDGPTRPELEIIDEIVDPPAPPTRSGGDDEDDSPDAQDLRDAFTIWVTYFIPPPQLPAPDPMDLPGCRLEIEAQLDPSLTVGQRILSWLTVDGSVEWNPADPLSPLFAPPTHERPMYEPLKDISQEWMMPGIGELKKNTVGLAVANQRFIEAYMTGLNHEMTRELLWNEYPTDQRGTYFRQFWSIAGHILEEGGPISAEGLRDIKPLRLWDKSADLGGNSPRPAPAGPDGEQFVVLVVRADLIRKYPNTIVYAQRLDEATDTLIGEQRTPIFEAGLPPDAACYGFLLTAAEIRADVRWYIIFQEQPGEPKFADETTVRSDFQYTQDMAAFGQHAGEIAEQTFLQPFRLGIQAIALLPPTEA